MASDGKRGVDLQASVVTEHVEDRSATHALVDRFVLSVVSGPDANATFESVGERVVVGTHESASFVLHDPTVSRFHFVIELAHKRFVLEDEGSRNGTLIDGVAVARGYLHDGAVITVGRTKLRFELASGSVRVPLSVRDRFGVALGASPSMRAAFRVLERAAPSDTTVLLEGETGTGKEIIAESIHRESARSEGPFIVVDCGAIPRDLLESELFGHERGAFSGAVAAREGAFEAANGGTIFLDEIGELAPELQPKLLRAIERREVKRVGSNRYAKVDVRIVAATNRKLRADVNAGTFRSDLFYRLAVVQVALPPLRERLDDIPLLVESMIAGMDANDKPGALLLRRPDVKEAMLRHAWPGNVRELRNYVERCITLEQSGPFDVAEPGATDGEAPAIDITRPLRDGREQWVNAFERAYLQATLQAHEGNVTAAARASKLDRIQFYRLLWRHGLK